MLCDVCNKREAKIYYTEIVNGKKKEQHLCEECAAEHTSFKIKNPITNKEFTLGSLLSGILETYSTTDAKDDGAKEVTCKKCGMKHSEFLGSGMFGCAECYHSFGKLITKSLLNLQGAELHNGKRPKGYISETNRIVNGLSEYEKLDIQLQQAIELEDFEGAAKLRDAMRAIKNKEVEQSNHEHQGC